MEIELRDYLVTPRRLDAWIRREGVVPIRKRCGLDLLGVG
jgi:hypothetical protein